MKLLAEIRIPSSYEGDPYHWTTNQMSHVWVAISLVAAICWPFYWYFGEWPVKVYAAIPLVAGYAFFEARSHWLGTWRGFWDSFWDTYFFGSGVWFAMTVGTENPETKSLEMDPNAMGIPFLLIWVGLMIGIVKREMQ